MHADNCLIQQQQLQDFRALPTRYPTRSRWGTQATQDPNMYQPITDNIIKGITTELNREDILADPNWTTQSTCLTTSNFDRSVINGTMSKLFGEKTKKVVISWKRALRKELPAYISNKLYNEQLYPELFGYFVEGARAQILDNGNGNVCYGVANGTPCTMVSLAWNDIHHEVEMRNLIRDSQLTTNTVHLPIAPDFIIVKVDTVDASTWPQHLNLSDDKSTIHIPIGLIVHHAGDSKHSVKFSDGVKIEYHPHAIDLSFAITTWKSQGATLDYVITLLEHSPNSPRLTFEMLYVMFSRARSANKFRCMPLSHSFQKSNLKKL